MKDLDFNIKDQIVKIDLQIIRDILIQIENDIKRIDDKLDELEQRIEALGG